MIQELQKQKDLEVSPLTKENCGRTSKILHVTYEEMDLQKGTLVEKRSIPDLEIHLVSI